MVTIRDSERTLKHTVALAVTNRLSSACVLALLALAGALAMLLCAAPSASASFGLITKWGSAGSGDGQFAEPQGIATDASGNVYVAEDGNDDLGNARIQKFTSSGGFLTKWGSPGTADGQLERAQGIATDSAGNVYVAEYQNNRVQKFTSAGAFVSAWGFGVTDAGAFYQVCTAPCHEGLPGAPVLGAPKGIATDTAGNVYVATTGYANGDEIQKFTSAGAQVTSWGSTGSADGQFQFLGGVATDTANNVYVSDGNGRIQKFSSTGTFLTKWDSDVSGSPQDIATDTVGNVYVLAGTGIQKFTSTGTSLGDLDISDGCALGALGIATDTAGNVYTANRDINDNPFIAKFGETAAPPTCSGDTPPSGGGVNGTPTAVPTGQRAAALKKCKKKKGKARKKCKQKANKLPV